LWRSRLRPRRSAAPSMCRKAARARPSRRPARCAPRSKTPCVTRPSPVWCSLMPSCCSRATGLRTQGKRRRQRATGNRGGARSAVPAPRQPSARRAAAPTHRRAPTPTHPFSAADGYSSVVARDLLITAALPQIVLDFNFVSDAAVIRATRRVSLVGLTIANSRCGSQGGGGWGGGTARRPGPLRAHGRRHR
jgi:hypothetical protein